MLICDLELINITHNGIKGKFSISEPQFSCLESDNNSIYLMILITCI